MPKRRVKAQIQDPLGIKVWRKGCPIGLVGFSIEKKLLKDATPPRSNATLQSCISLLIVDGNAIATEEERHCILCDASNVRCH
ncbi:hypothetical protein HZ326_7501 [Fusarium oxysporum f. sp. albedinis]|nr:hypothetical protein HZ326_7501 [Fusarium oxysporum f. sp. albedinis]